MVESWMGVSLGLWHMFMLGNHFSRSVHGLAMGRVVALWCVAVCLVWLFVGACYHGGCDWV